MIPWLDACDPFPPLKAALTEPNGLLAAGADLSAPRLLDAYARGIFPWYSAGSPILWWSPDPRAVLAPGELRVRRSLAKVLRNRPWQVTADAAFGAVIRACAAPREAGGGTWITAAMIDAYEQLHAAGYAHSVEVWRDGRLTGGLYGVALGRAFFGESMFSRVADASKVALVCLARQLERWDFGLIDCQMLTAHLQTMGARAMPRAEFAGLIARLLQSQTDVAPWRFDDDLIERHSA